MAKIHSSPFFSYKIIPAGEFFQIAFKVTSGSWKTFGTAYKSIEEATKRIESNIESDTRNYEAALAAREHEGIDF